MLIQSPETTIVIGVHEAIVQEAATIHDIQEWNLVIDGLRLRTIDFIKYYQPEAVVLDQYLVIWGGSRMHVADVLALTVRSFDRDDDILAVLPKPPYCYVCGESTVALFDVEAGIDVKRVLHNEIIIESWLLEDELWIKDLSGRTTRVEL